MTDSKLENLVPEVPSDILQGIGGYFVAFSKLESMLDVLIWELLQVPSAGFGTSVTCNLAYRKKIEIARSLFELRGGDSLSVEALTDILKAVVKCEERRNQLAHSMWASRTEGGTSRLKATTKQDKPLKFSRELITPDGLLKDVRETVEATAKLNWFLLAWKFPDQFEEMAKIHGILTPPTAQSPPASPGSASPA